MPRRAGLESCLTCRKRKLRCDGQFPTCARCIKAKLYCDRSSELVIKAYKISRAEIDDPRALLEQAHIAKLFQTYIKELAPWYDLNDAGRTFAKDGARRALERPLLFAAAIALAALYQSRKGSSSAKLAEHYHARCLKHLIGITPDDPGIRDGTALAATCLLRSYEILSEKSDPNRHLFGASALLPPDPPSLSARTLVAAGFWNFLREDITYSLIHRCCLKIGIERCFVEPEDQDDSANAVTLVLAQTVNWYFSASSNLARREMLEQDLGAWRRSFKSTSFVALTDEKTLFPVIMMLEDSYVAAMHYFYVTSCLLATDDKNREHQAAQICGLAMFSDSDPVVVNAYGPICFTSQWLTSEVQQTHLLKWLEASQHGTAWSVDVITQRLRDAWRARSG